MHKVSLRSRSQQLTEQELEAFQSKFAIMLPGNYKKLLLKYNGGIVENSEHMKLLLPLSTGSVTVAFMIETHQVTEKNIDCRYLPIAIDRAGNPITINLENGNDYGQIIQFWFDTDAPPEKIAGSLEQLFGVNSIDEV